MYPLIYGGDAPNTASGYTSSICTYENMKSYAAFLICLSFFFQKKKLRYAFSNVTTTQVLLRELFE